MAEQTLEGGIEFSLGRRPRNKFLIFVDLERLTQQAVNPEEKKLTLKKLGRIWRTLSEEAKEMYEALAEAERIEFQKIEEQFWAENPVRCGQKATEVSGKGDAPPLPRRSVRLLNKSSSHV